MTPFLSVVLGLVIAIIVALLLTMAWIAKNAIASHREGILRVSQVEKTILSLGFALIAATITAIVGSALRMFRSPRPTADPSATFILPLAVLFFVGVASVLVLMQLANRRRVRAQGSRNRASKELFERIRAGKPLDQPLFVYLRPFSSREKRTVTEELVIELFEKRGTLICIDEPGFQYGIGRLAFGDDEWQSAVIELCERATAIVLHPAASAGTAWELGSIANRGWLDRTIFFMPPNVPMHHLFSAVARRLPPERRGAFEQLDLRESWEAACTRARELDVELPQYRDAGGLFRIIAGHPAWIAGFSHEHFVGKKPTESLASLDPVLDTLIDSSAHR